MNKNLKLWILFIVTMSIYLFMMLYNLPKLITLSNGFEPLDMLPFYDSEYIIQLFEYQENEGRAFYLYRQIPIDMVYATLFGLTYYLILKHFFQKLAWQKVSFLVFLPIVGAFFDITENISIATMLYTFPSLPEVLLRLTPYFSLLKTSFVSLSLLVFFISGILVLVKRRKNVPL
ncbi:MAG: hypothetical protein Q4C98_11550 [Capnocytophaga sp.]|nr:hypothetical protein [Capnocytophaga sp.]